MISLLIYLKICKYVVSSIYRRRANKIQMELWQTVFEKSKKKNK